MEIDHGTLVAFSKSFGLFYLMILFVAALVYACWPSNRNRFDRAKHSILNDEDGPCQ